MKIRSVRIQNIKSVVDSGLLELSPRVNVVIGHNNAGKSVLIRAIHSIQSASLNANPDIRLGAAEGAVDLMVTNAERELPLLGESGASEATLQIRLSRQTGQINRMLTLPNSNRGMATFPQSEPNNAIYPFLAKRKVMTYDEVVNQGKTVQVADDFRYLVSKVDRLTTPSHELFSEFRSHCRDIIGFEIDSVPAPGGHKIGFPVGRTDAITLETMGEGVPHLLALIADLCIADQKIFLIEEIENDLHPRALKNLLALVADKSERNQFIITTHSNIVARYLGSVPESKTFRVRLTFQDQVPTAEYSEVAEDPEARREVLEELGYEMTDYDLWDAWLILEESSAERIINDVLIPAFAPNLRGRLRTIAAGGVDAVEAKFDDFNRLFLFTHLTPSYRNRAWVVVDRGTRGDAVVQELIARYSSAGWSADHFRTWQQDDFERYYPAEFSEKVKSALATADSKAKQEAKTALMHDLLEWVAADQPRARKAFSESAGEVINVLKQIEDAIGPHATVQALSR